MLEFFAELLVYNRNIVEIYIYIVGLNMVEPINFGVCNMFEPFHIISSYFLRSFLGKDAWVPPVHSCWRGHHWMGLAGPNGNDGFGGLVGSCCMDASIWVCLKIGYTPNYSHLIGIMIINHWVYGYTIFRHTHLLPWRQSTFSWFFNPWTGEMQRFRHSLMGSRHSHKHILDHYSTFKIILTVL